MQFIIVYINNYNCKKMLQKTAILQIFIYIAVKDKIEGES